jgi:hypothetical protein
MDWGIVCALAAEGASVATTVIHTADQSATLFRSMAIPFLYQFTSHTTA